MTWQSPSFVEIRMDAEIGAYQDESDPTRNWPIAAPSPSPARATDTVETSPGREP